MLLYQPGCRCCSGRTFRGVFALDDAQRRKFGIPRIDKHVYARENGWVIQALATLYAATGETGYLDDAITAATWMMEHRSLGGGGFSHDEKDAAGPYLGDTLAMGGGFLALYTATADTAWLDRAIAAANFINEKFKSDPGFSTAFNAGTIGDEEANENVALARFANLLKHYSDILRLLGNGRDALRYLVSASRRTVWISGRRYSSGRSEFSSAPSHHSRRSQEHFWRGCCSLLL